MSFILSLSSAFYLPTSLSHLQYLKLHPAVQLSGFFLFIAVQRFASSITYTPDPVGLDSFFHASRYQVAHLVYYTGKSDAGMKCENGVTQLFSVLFLTVAARAQRWR